MSDNNTERESARRALFTGNMDVDGMDEVLTLYRDLFDLAGENIPVGEEKRSLTGKESEMRLGESFTLVDLEDLLPDPVEMTACVGAVVQVLTRHSEDAGVLKQDLAGLIDDPASLIGLTRVYLNEGEEALRKELLSVEGANPEVVIFVLFNALKSAFLKAAARCSAVDTLSWKEGYCPVCGGEAAVSYMMGEGGKRYLICFRCETHWRYKRLACPYCGKEDSEHSGLLYSDDAGYRNLSANVCSECRSYIKGWRIEGDELDDFHPQIEDLKTPGFDRAVEEEGFSRGAPNIYGVWIGTLTDESADLD